MTLTCPICGAPMDRNDKLVKGHVVLRCKGCRLYQIEGDIDWFTVNETGVNSPPSMPVYMRLQRRANDLDEAKRYQEMLDADIEDPRWTKVEL